MLDQSVQGGCSSVRRGWRVLRRKVHRRDVCGAQLGLQDVRQPLREQHGLLFAVLQERLLLQHPLLLHAERRCLCERFRLLRRPVQQGDRGSARPVRRGAGLWRGRLLERRRTLLGWSDLYRRRAPDVRRRLLQPRVLPVWTDRGADLPAAERLPPDGRDLQRRCRLLRFRDAARRHEDQRYLLQGSGESDRALR